MKFVARQFANRKITPPFRKERGLCISGGNGRLLWQNWHIVAVTEIFADNQNQVIKNANT